MVLDAVKNILNIDWGKTRLENIPLHVALTVNGIYKYAELNKLTAEEAYAKSFAQLMDIFRAQVDHKIRILTIYLMPKFRCSDPELIKASINLIAALAKDQLIHENQVKVTVLGKWYDLPGELVEQIKSIISETKDYDRFFINLCMNYSGRDEILDACRLIAMNIKAGKLDPEAITKENIKENLYTSYFVPPDIIIKTGMKQKLFGLLLWDTILSDIHFAKKLFPDFTAADFLKIIQSWERDKETE